MNDHAALLRNPNNNIEYIHLFGEGSTKGEVSPKWASGRYLSRSIQYAKGAHEQDGDVVLIDIEASLAKEPGENDWTKVITGMGAGDLEVLTGKYRWLRAVRTDGEESDPWAPAQVDLYIHQGQLETDRQ